MKFEVYKDGAADDLFAKPAGLLAPTQWRWRLRADNGRIIANGGEAFHNQQDCLDSVKLVQGSYLTPVVVL